MLRLTTESDESPTEYSFNEALVSIGSAPAASDHLHISLQNIQPQHVQIVLNHRPPTILNLANDPFVTLNGLPFARKTLGMQDLLEIHGLSIRIDILAGYEEDHSLQNVPEELDEETPIETPSTTFLHSPHRKKWLYQGFLSFICISLLAGIFIYYKANDRNDEYHHTAAEGIADIGMALVYARAHHIKPVKQSWVDPEFLTNNLSAVLSTEYPTFAHIDSQGEFRNCPYHLRVYTSTDLSQFLAIAQPNPGWLSSVFSPDAIMLDSQAMELYKSSDLKALNRLLVNTNSLDGIQDEVFHLVHQGKKIPLASLRSRQGFAPPKALKLSRPGAEDRIYNAPRYYHFGEEMLKAALALSETSDNPQEIARLQQHIEALKKLPDLVLYSSQGFEKALEAQQALASITHASSFLVACLHKNEQGHITSSKLLFEGEIPTIAKNTPVEKELVAETKPEAVKLDAKENTLLNEREHSLEALSEPMIRLLERNNKEPIEVFEKEFADLLMEYLGRNEEFRESLQDKDNNSDTVLNK